ncbi:MAG: HAD hydrolase-like protein [Puniceicoccales bacterium]|jgi:HAD superfamily hydrolase (TIGR01450 family)|nr:HAD hydrolase-like protein [Puniceicoccales bacterium]
MVNVFKNNNFSEMTGRELLSSYEILLVDLYGVIWGGGNAFPEALVALEEMISSGKEVLILSNASTVSTEIIKKYDAANLCGGVHFTHFVTSGDVMRDIFSSGGIPFLANREVKKYFVCGTPNNAIFADSKLEQTEDLDESDFIYLSIPRFFDAERDAMPDALKQFLYVARADGENRSWDSTSIEPYIPKLKIFLAKKKLLVLANPDKFAVCHVLETPESAKYVPKLVAKQGLVAEAYESLGGKVLAMGKPFPQIYHHALEKLAAARRNSVEQICKSRIAMIGDTLETDILGARNASENMGCKIDSILVLTGISAGDMRKSMAGETTIDAMDNFFAAKKIFPTHAMSALNLAAQVYF